MSKISENRLEKCLNELIKHSKSSFVTDDLWIEEYFSNENNFAALRALSACGAVNYSFTYSGNLPSVIIVQDDAYLLLHRIYNDKTLFIKGYVLGIISAVLSGVLVNVITAILQ